MLSITLLGTGSPMPDPHRAGPATLVTRGAEHYLVDAGRGVLMRLAGAMVGGVSSGPSCSRTCTAITSPISTT